MSPTEGSMILARSMFMATAVCALTAIAGAATINVPADHPTIQRAIDAAVNGDTVIVAPGTYNEAINFSGKAITVKSSGSAEATVISAKGLNTSVVTCTSGETANSKLLGFTITQGAGTPVQIDYPLGGGMYCINSSPLISYCIFSANA